jgi:hypothetical protein
MRERSKALNKDAPEFQEYRSILSRLRDEIGVYNLNYESVAISAWPDAVRPADAFTGFRHGKFDARAVGLQKKWEFIYHLHGSYSSRSSAGFLGRHGAAGRRRRTRPKGPIVLRTS